MTALASISLGTVTVANGDTAIAGNGVDWSDVRSGDVIIVDGTPATEIKDSVDGTHVSLWGPWSGGNKAGAAYVIVQKSPSRFVGGEAAADVSRMIAYLKIKGLFVVVGPDDDGPDPSLGEEDQFALQPSTGRQWQKTAGAWVFKGVFKGINPRGEYDAAAAYGIADAVSKDGGSYLAIAPSTNQAPPNATYWMELAAMGVGATVSVHSTTTGAPGANASVTNVGTATAASLDFVIPQGKGYGGTSTNTINLASIGGIANMLLWSEEFSNAVWSKAAMTIAADAAAGADGTMTMDKMVESNASAIHYLSQAISIPANTVHTVSFFASYSGRRYLQFGFDGGGNSIYATFDMTTGTVASTANAQTTASVVNLGGGLYRLLVTGNPGLANANRVFVVLTNAASGFAPTYAGDGASGSYLWGAHLVPVAGNPGYVKTTNTPAAGVSLIVPAGLAYQIGGRVRIASTVAPQNYFEILVTSYSGNILSGMVVRVVGSGTFSSWTLGTTGDPGSGDMLSTNYASEYVGHEANVRRNLYAAPFDAVAYNGMQINGSCEVSQELVATSKSYPSGSAAYIADGWRISTSGAQVVSVQQVADAPPGFSNSLKLTVATANASPGAGDGLTFQHRFEGYRVARLGFGAANAAPMSIGFWVKAHRPGAYSGSVDTPDTTRSYPFSFTVNSADTWEFKTVTLQGDTTGTWPKGAVSGMIIFFAIMSGTTAQGAAGGWLAGDYRAVTGTINGVAATTDTFQITGLIVLPGLELPSADRSPFIMRPFDQELTNSLRYYQKSYAYGTLPGTAISGGVGSELLAYAPNNVFAHSFKFYTKMRISPTLTSYDNAGTSGRISYYDGSWHNGAASGVSARGDGGMIINTAPATGALYVNYDWVADARV